MAPTSPAQSPLVGGQCQWLGLIGRGGGGTHTVGRSCADEWSYHLCVDGIEADVGCFDDDTVGGEGWERDVVTNGVVECIVGYDGALGGG